MLGIIVVAYIQQAWMAYDGIHVVALGVLKFRDRGRCRGVVAVSRQFAVTFEAVMPITPAYQPATGYIVKKSSLLWQKFATI